MAAFSSPCLGKDRLEIKFASVERESCVYLTVRVIRHRNSKEELPMSTFRLQLALPSMAEH